VSLANIPDSGYNSPLLSPCGLLQDSYEETLFMPQRVTLDAMIPREDIAVQVDGVPPFIGDLFERFPIEHLTKGKPIQRLLRKPDFQRETNHWSPEQLVTFIASFLDSEVIPSLILWMSPNYVFVIDGGHRLSALRAWMEDDYGDGPISLEFYKGEITEEQKKIAKKTRALIETKIGRFSTMKEIVGSEVGTDEQKRRATKLFTRTLQVQWIQGSVAVAETSFYKINSQGTPLDETEEKLIRNRRKPIAIAARAILRAGAGHKYWSGFPITAQQKIVELASEFYNLVFRPEVEEPLKTLEVSLGGSVSPIDALSLLIEFMAITGSTSPKGKVITEYDDDATGEETVGVIERSFEIIKRFTGNTGESLGLHPAVYFYNEKGKYSRFLFLSMAQLITERVRNNDSGFFKKFTSARERLEQFLIDNKSLIGIVLQNLSRGQRIPRIRDMYMYLIAEFNEGRTVSVEALLSHLGLSGRVFDIVQSHAPREFPDDAKSMIFINRALEGALRCPICNGRLDPKKSVSYDHVIPKRQGGKGEPANGALVHPYCNTGIKN
jgi:hypothetical protein